MKRIVVIILAVLVLFGCSSSTSSRTRYPQLLNVSTGNDLAFLLNMDYEIAEKFWGKDEVEIIERIDAPKKLTVVLAPGIYIDVGHGDKIDTISIVYTERNERDSASLLGLNGYETIESIAERFGKENVYPYNQKNEYIGTAPEISKEMCSVVLYDHYFYRANFDENGVMTDAFIGGGI